MKPLLVIQADDAGIHPAIDRGILEAIDRGPITSVGVIVCGDHAPDLAESLERRPQIGVGLHFALTRAPALASTRLAMSGEMMPSSWSQLARRVARGAVGRDDLTSELRAQINRARTLGLKLDHLDAHEHVHLMPGIADVFARIAIDERLPRRVRISRTPRMELARDARAIALRAASSFSRRTAWRQFVSPDRIVGIADLGEIKDLTDVLAAVRPGSRSVELIVHPGDRALPGEPPLPDWSFDWLGELYALTSADWKHRLGREYTLGTYRELPENT
jgi:predicted glycoside hydrolase/deacetylase ChbG (UPF0249 family)